MTINSVVPCYRGGHRCRWPACPADCDGRPGLQRDWSPESFADWEARLSAWLASLPSDDARLRMNEIDQCAEFSKAEEKATRELRKSTRN